jgi:hypothetical protein
MGGWSTPRPGRFTAGEDLVPIVWGCVGPKAGLDGCGKSRPPPGFDFRNVQPVPSRYTDWATPAPSPPYSIVKQIFVVSHQIRPTWQYPLNTKGIKNHEAGVTSTGKTSTFMWENLSTKVAVVGHTQDGALVCLQDKQAGWHSSSTLKDTYRHQWIYEVTRPVTVVRTKG